MAAISSMLDVAHELIEYAVPAAETPKMQKRPVGRTVMRSSRERVV